MISGATHCRWGLDLDRAQRLGIEGALLAVAKLATVATHSAGRWRVGQNGGAEEQASQFILI
jgi:hypothetical protein